jgi:hypothetical protein
MLAPALTTSWETMSRSIMSRSHSASGRGELSLGRSADPRRVTEARNRRLRTHGVALFARPTDGTVTDVTYIPREPLRPARVHLADGAIVRGGRSRRHRHLPPVVPPSALVARWGVRLHPMGRCRSVPFAPTPTHVSWCALCPGSPSTIAREREIVPAVTHRHIHHQTRIGVRAQVRFVRTGIGSFAPADQCRTIRSPAAGSSSRASLCAIELSICRKAETSSFGQRKCMSAW